MPVSVRPAPLALALALLFAAPACAASTVSVGAKEDAFGATFRFTGGAGESSTTRFVIGVKTIAISDTSADLLPGRGCLAHDARHVVCRSQRSAEWTSTLRFGDGDDRAVFVTTGGSSGGRLIAHGGPGDDALNAARVTQYGFFYGGPGDDTILGTTDGDAIVGGAGRDSLHGRDGADTLHPDPAGSVAGDDFIEGGRGEDAVSYGARTRPVSIDLRRAAPQGSAGEHDTFVGIESATGTAGDDVLLGNGGDNDLMGLKGRDRIEGFGGDDRVWANGGGPDRLTGDAGADTVIADGGGTGLGGPGDDSVSGHGATLVGGDGDDTFDVVGGSVSCDAGADAVSLAKPDGPLLGSGCESLTLGGAEVFFVGAPPRREDGGIRVGISCDDEDGPVALCKGRFTAALGTLVLASAAYDVSGEGSKTLHARYRAGAIEALGAEPKRVRVSFGRYAFEMFL